MLVGTGTPLFSPSYLGVIESFDRSATHCCAPIEYPRADKQTRHRGPQQASREHKNIHASEIQKIHIIFVRQRIKYKYKREMLFFVTFELDYYYDRSEEDVLAPILSFSIACSFPICSFT